MQGVILEDKFYWNLEANVGPGCPNKPEDVQLVQLGYWCKVNNPKFQQDTPEVRAVYSAVVPGAPYTGGWNDPLSVAIRVHQKVRGGTQDGMVSRIKNSTGSYANGVHWMLVALLNNIGDVMGLQWPHLDKHPMCPPALRDGAIRVLRFPTAA